MCGIAIIFEDQDNKYCMKEALFSQVKCRGPDCSNSFSITLDKQIRIILFGSVLWLQGEKVQEQPLVDERGNILLWNGDILSGHKVVKTHSDTSFIMQSIKDKNELEIAEFFSSIKGPWSMIYYQSTTMKLFIGKDILGRHSLLWSLSSPLQNFVITSVATRDCLLEEVPPYGLFIVDLNKFTLHNPPSIHIIPWNTLDINIHDYTNFTWDEFYLSSPISVCLNKSLPSEDEITLFKQMDPILLVENHFASYLETEVTEFIKNFKEAIIRRIKACPPICKSCPITGRTCLHSRFGVLFSGGLDSAIIALVLSFCLPKEEPIDLFNIAFQVPIKDSLKANKKHNHLEDTQTKSNFETPDRISGELCLQQLRDLQPERKWNFIEINITAEELQKERRDVISNLIAPQASVLDDSIGCALYFCGRGAGLLNGLPYTSPSRVIFSGLGADEQLAGYSRHRNSFQKDGWSGLLQEIEIEMRRLHSRNLGRDNRVLAHHGRSPRFPYLDEDVVSFLNSVPIWKKANLYLPRGVGEKILLRAVAASLGLTYAASLPKRAIQFGSRIAKLENSKEKGSDNCARFEHG